MWNARSDWHAALHLHWEDHVIIGQQVSYPNRARRRHTVWQGRRIWVTKMKSARYDLERYLVSVNALRARGPTPAGAATCNGHFLAITA